MWRGVISLAFAVIAAAQYTPPNNGGGGGGTIPTPVNQGGTGTTSTLTGLVRGGSSAMTASELSGDAATSGSNAVTVSKINGTTVPTSAVVLGTNSSAQPAAASTTGTGTTVALSSGPTFTNPVVGTQTQADNSTKGASTAYVDTAVSNAIAGVNPAVAVQAATAAVLPNSPNYANAAAGIGATLIATGNAALVVDGYTPIVGDRILVKTQASALQNGVYTVTATGSGIALYTLTRALDYDQPSDTNNTGSIPVVNGTANAQTSWVLTSTVGAIGTDALTFTQFTLKPTTLVTATSPGAGIAHFAGSTQAVTSSLIVNADITDSTIDLTAKVTGILPAANIPNVPVTISTSGAVADPGNSSDYQFNNASGALTFNAPAGIAGLQRCYRNATGKSGAITIQMATSNTVDLAGANGSSAGTLVSGGALGDAVCIVSDAANHWYAFVQTGTWTNN